MGKLSQSYLKELAEKKKYQSEGFSTEDKQFSVKKSTIPGANKGLFSKTPIKQGKLIGLAHENNQPVGTLGNMHNHSETPNMQSVKVGNQRYVYATRDIQPGEELTTNYRLQPELEQPEDFMGNKRFGQKGFYKPDFRSKSQIANAQGQQREYTNVPIQRTPAEAKAIREKELAELKRRTVGTIRETTDQDREIQNRQALTFAGNAEKRGASSPLNDVLDMVNPFSYYYSTKDIGKGLGQAAKGVYNLDPNQIAGGLTQAGLNALYVLPAASELKPVLKGAGKYLTTQTPLRNTYKINPFAFKPQEGMMYRGLGEEGFADAIQSGVFRPKQHGYSEGRTLAEKVSSPKQFGSVFYAPAERFGVVENYGPSYLAEVPFAGNQFARRYGRKDWSWSTPRQIPIEEGRILQKDWLRGYKPVEVPKQSFKSEIDWAKWNPDTPKYPELINEYNAIEQSTKKAGTWMKNPDGSAFQGTPEQFIQQQSSYFKKAFPSPLRDEAGNVQFTYHGSPNTFDVFDENMVLTGRTRGHGIYTSPYREKAASYAKGKDGKLYEFYQNASKKQDKLANLEKESNERFAQFLKDNPKNSPDFDKKLKAFMDEEDKLYNALDIKEFKLQPGYDFYKANADEYVVPFTNYPKSAIGNVGFFDMTNPNIYKGVLPYVLPIGAGLGAGAYQQFNQKPKGTYQMGGTIGIPGVNGQVVSSGPQPLTSVRKTRGPINKTKKGDVKTMSSKQVKQTLKYSKQKPNKI